mmetsp:Transcript_8692/g.23335  ORF Transcript_8692/g.23335 Transcript_8692/m.23335 type:complete len:126 (-) Transcript_8692:1744-2121(-)
MHKQTHMHGRPQEHLLLRPKTLTCHPHLRVCSEPPGSAEESKPSLLGAPSAAGFVPVGFSPPLPRVLSSRPSLPTLLVFDGSCCTSCALPMAAPAGLVSLPLADGRAGKLVLLSIRLDVKEWRRG